ncbi:MAG: tetratricopeptide repeat protein [Pseudomonadota bacterium]
MLHASLGQLLLRQERYAQAINELTAALDARPGNAGWLASRAEAHEHSGAIFKAVEDAAGAVIAEPANAGNAALLARLLQRSGRHDEAVVSWAEAIRLDGNQVTYYEGLAHSMWIKGNLEAAIEIYDKLRETYPESESYYVLIAEIHMQRQQPADAAAICKAAIDRGIKTAVVYRSYGNAMLLLGDKAKASELFRGGLATAPKDGYLLHMLATASGEPTDRAPEDYIRAVFDGRADTYEAGALFKLGIRSPGLIRREILRIRPKLDPSRPAAHKLSAVLDIGCGTGLTGALTYDLTAYLKGVDLSRNIVRYAQIKGIYHEIEISDIVAGMNSDPRLYECIVAGDVLCYLGEPQAGLRGGVQAHAAQRPVRVQPRGRSGIMARGSRRRHQQGGLSAPGNGALRPRPGLCRAGRQGRRFRDRAGVAGGSQLRERRRPAGLRHQLASSAQLTPRKTPADLGSMSAGAPRFFDA